MAENYKELQTLEITGVNAKNTGAIKIGTTQNGSKNFHPLYVVFLCTAGTLITLVPSMSVGTNASNYNNILAISALTSVTGANTFMPFNMTVATGNIAPNTDVYVNITTGATATTMTISVFVFGFYH